jgi:hypothetical protein
MFIVFILQHIEMAPAEVEWLSCYMGHDKNVHKSSYRLHTSAVEITKVGKILTAIDSGVVGRQKPAEQTTVKPQGKTAKQAKGKHVPICGIS